MGKVCTTHAAKQCDESTDNLWGVESGWFVVERFAALVPQVAATSFAVLEVNARVTPCSNFLITK